VCGGPDAADKRRRGRGVNLRRRVVARSSQVTSAVRRPANSSLSTQSYQLFIHLSPRRRRCRSTYAPANLSGHCDEQLRLLDTGRRPNENCSHLQWRFCVQSPPSARTVTLPAFAAERWRLLHGARSCRSISPTRRALSSKLAGRRCSCRSMRQMDKWTDGRTDGRSTIT